MEGRMMLSASGLDVAPPALDMSLFTIAPRNISFAAANVTLTTQSSDGGYTFSDGMYTNSDGVFTSYPSIGGVASPVLTAVSDRHGTSVAGIQQLYGVAGQDINLLPPWQFTTSYDSDGLQPAVIVSQANGSGLAPDLKPIVIGPSPTAPGSPEGGSIPIHAIFADFRKDSNLVSGGKSISSPATESTLESLASMRRASTSDNAITGEWARAMVFEIAGGEPTASDSHLLGEQPATTSSTDDKLEHSEPVSSIETLQQNEQLASRQSVGRPTNEALVNEQGQLQADQSYGQITAVSTKSPRGGHRTAGSATPAQISQFAADWSAESATPDLTATAAATVFDQLGEGNAAVIESTLDGKSWLRSIGASPLLMVLALERIAALNSRRARESRIAAAKPLRSRS
jgi:hypothetical protein